MPELTVLANSLVLIRYCGCIKCNIGGGWGEGTQDFSVLLFCRLLWVLSHFKIKGDDDDDDDDDGSGSKTQLRLSAPGPASGQPDPRPESTPGLRSAKDDQESGRQAAPRPPLCLAALPASPRRHLTCSSHLLIPWPKQHEEIISFL